MHLFYTPDIEPLAAEYTLNEDESKHCVNVLRLVSGDAVQLIDGKGGFYSAVILLPNPRKTTLKVNSVIAEYKKRNHYLHIAIAPTKNIERFEWFLEKSSEIGIDEITPVICQRSERREVKTERLNKIITSAIKQSVKAYHPVLNGPVSFKDAMNQAFAGQRFIAHCENGSKTDLRSELGIHGKCLVLIGPEGDFTNSEIDSALANGFKAITLGESRLRTETAGLEACFEVNFLNR